MNKELIAEFETALLAAHRSPSTIRERVGDLDRYFKTTGIEPSMATTKDLIDYMANGINSGWKPEYAKRIRSTFRVFFMWLHAEGLREDNPALALPTIRVPRPLHTLPIPTEGTVQCAYTDAPNTAVRLAIALGAVLGLRRTEIATLRLADRYGETLRVQGKGGVTRYLDLDASMIRLLSEREQEVQFGEFYYPGRWHGHIHPSTIYRWVRPLTGTGLHALRRRAGTNGHNRVGDLRAIQAFLGHSSLDTTQRYVGLSKPSMRRIAEANALGTTVQQPLLDDEAELLSKVRALDEKLRLFGWKVQIVPQSD